MMYLYDGKRLVGIECRTWDKEEHRYLYASTEEDAILRPEYEEGLPTLTAAGPVEGNSRVYAVTDVQWYIDEAEAWEKYQHGFEEDYSEQEDGEAERYERSAYVEELDVAAYEAEHMVFEGWDAECNPDPKDRRATIADAKAAIAAKG